MIFSLEPVRPAAPEFAPGPCRAVVDPKGFEAAERALADLEMAARGATCRREPRWLGWALLGVLTLWGWVLLRSIDIAILRAVGR